MTIGEAKKSFHLSLTDCLHEEGEMSAGERALNPSLDFMNRIKYVHYVADKYKVD